MSDLSTGNNSEEEEANNEPDQLETPDDLQDFTPSPKKRDVSTFTEEFTFVILPHLALVLVYITSATTGLSGYCNDLRQAIRLKNPNQDDCPYITYSEAEKRDPVRNVCPGLWGPYTRVNDKEEPIQEKAQQTFRTIRNLSAGGDSQSYPATCFILIPKLTFNRQISKSSVEAQVQEIANYCNKVYVANQRSYQSFNHQAPKTPQKRSFGLARQPNRTNNDVHNGLPLNKFIARRHVVDFLTNAYHCDNDFYRNKTSVAKRLLHPPHSYEETRLGYPLGET